jgi:hypothetical protein
MRASKSMGQYKSHGFMLSNQNHSIEPLSILNEWSPSKSVGQAHLYFMRILLVNSLNHISFLSEHIKNFLPHTF